MLHTPPLLNRFKFCKECLKKLVYLKLKVLNVFLEVLKSQIKVHGQKQEWQAIQDILHLQENSEKFNMEKL